MFKWRWLNNKYIIYLLRGKIILKFKKIMQIKNNNKLYINYNLKILNFCSKCKFSSHGLKLIIKYKLMVFYIIDN